jgi:hypothetical protein
VGLRRPEFRCQKQYAYMPEPCTHMSCFATSTPVCWAYHRPICCRPGYIQGPSYEISQGSRPLQPACMQRLRSSGTVKKRGTKQNLQLRDSLRGTVAKSNPPRLRRCNRLTPLWQPLLPVDTYVCTSGEQTGQACTAVQLLAWHLICYGVIAVNHLLPSRPGGACATAQDCFMPHCRYAPHWHPCCLLPAGP